MDIGSHTQVSHTQRNLSGEADEELLQHTAGHLLGLHSVRVHGVGGSVANKGWLVLQRTCLNYKPGQLEP